LRRKTKTNKFNNFILEITTEGSNNARALGIAMIPGHHIISIDIDDSYNNIS
jgi:hypothetical protein